MKKRIPISDFRAGSLRENTLVAIIENEHGRIETLVAIERVKSRGESNQRPYVTFISGAKFHRRLGTFNGRRAWLFMVDDDMLQELVEAWKAAETTRLAVAKLVNR